VHGIPTALLLGGLAVMICTLQAASQSDYRNHATGNFFPCAAVPFTGMVPVVTVPFPVLSGGMIRPALAVLPVCGVAALTEAAILFLLLG
jgi:hypothetical protein